MAQPPTIALGLILFMVSGTIACNNGSDERISRLEKQNEDLKAQIAKDHPVQDYDLQAKCSKDSKLWFNDSWAGTKDAILLDYTNHYNKAQNKCFILVEYHYSLDKNNGSWDGNISLWDVYENAKYAIFSETHMISFKPKVETNESVIQCEILTSKCKTVEEFNNLVRPYMDD